MSLYLCEQDRQTIWEVRQRGDLLVNRFWTALMSRVARRASSPGLLERGEDAAWWYPAAEYLSDAAMAHALQPAPMLAAWVRDVSLSIARRPESDWVGPWYRDHATRPAVGNLETAHLCWGLAAALDLAPEVFTAGEQAELLETLEVKGIALCRRWLERNTHLANWRSVLVAGLAAAAAVTGDREAIQYAARETLLGAQAYQPDGSYAESLQYANYLAFALMISYESIHGAAPELETAGPEVLGRLMPWFTQSMLYARPLSGWDASPRARALNFNDSAAMFRPSADVLLQVAARCRTTLPKEAGLARWLFDTFYAPVPAQQPHNLATFGLRNDWGFLTLPFLVRSAGPLSPDEAGLPTAASFSNGNIMLRDGWKGRTVLAVQGGSGPLYGPGHLHGDLNSFILVHNGERLLVDPGHNCYRNLIHGLESATQTHNTCSFLLAEDALGLQEDLAKAALLEQSQVAPRRMIIGGQLGEPVAPRGRRLLLERIGEVTATGSEAGELYGDPIQEFSRFWLQAGPHVLFVVDRIRAARPVTTVWNWLLNNRDNASEIDVLDPRTVVLRRGLAGLKLAHLDDGRLHGPIYAFVQDAYHPEPDQRGVGRSGSGMLYRWIERRPATFRLVVHAVAVDDYGLIDGWNAQRTGTEYCLTGPDKTGTGCRPLAENLGSHDGVRVSVPVLSGPATPGDDRWTLAVRSDNPLDLLLRGSHDGGGWRLKEQDGRFTFSRIERAR